MATYCIDPVLWNSQPMTSDLRPLPLTSAPVQVETRLRHPTRYHMLQVWEELYHSAEDSPPAQVLSLQPDSTTSEAISETTSETNEVST